MITINIKEKIVEELLDNNLYKYIEEINLKYNSELKENLIKLRNLLVILYTKQIKI